MEPKFATIFCYWGGEICNGQEGVSYNMPPTKAIKVQFGIQFDQLIEKLHSATSIDKQRYRINIVCRYPSVVGKVMRYVSLPIKDNDDVEIMFDALNLHRELSNIDLYLEVEDAIGSKRRTEMAFGNQDSFFIENETPLPSRRHANVVSNVIQNEGSNTVSQTAFLNNASSSEFNTGDVLEGEENTALYVDGDEVDNDVQVPSSFTRIENIDRATADSETVSRFKNENELTKELGRNYFKDKKELIRAIKLYSIKNHIQYEVVETCPTIWRIRCKLHLECSCKWQVRACKRKRSGYFEITKYTGPHTCLDYRISQDHLNLDASLIAQETEHIIKEEPSISIPALRAKIIDKLGYNVSYKKVWSGKQKAMEQIFGNETLRMQAGMTVKEGKLTILCGICRQSGHNKKTCPSRSG